MGTASYALLLILPILFQNESVLANKLGCTPGSESSGGVLNAIYGSQVFRYQLESSAELLALTLKIQDVLTNLLAISAYSTVETFLDFYDFYKEKQNVMNPIMNVYHYYTPYYREGTSYALAIDILDRLVLSKQYANLSDYYYLATADNNPSNEIIARLQLDNQIPRYFNHKHIAGFIPYSIPSEGSEGIILIDPAMGFQFPVLVKENIPDSARSSAGHQYEVKFLENTSNKYIVATEVQSQSKILYHVALPFCSYLQSTMKNSLTYTKLLVEKRNERGLIDASVIIAPFPFDSDLIQEPNFVGTVNDHFSRTSATTSNLGLIITTMYTAPHATQFEENDLQILDSVIKKLGRYYSSTIWSILQQFDKISRVTDFLRLIVNISLHVQKERLSVMNADPVMTYVREHIAHPSAQLVEPVLLQGYYLPENDNGENEENGYDPPSGSED